MGVLLLEKLLAAVQRSRISLDSLPNVSVYLSTDGALMLEWIFKHFRIGFSLEEAEEESFWFLVSTPDYGGLQVSGVLQNVNIDPVIAWLVCYVVNNG